MKIKTSELTGDALDWAVGAAAGLKLRVRKACAPGNRVFEKRRRSSYWYCPSQSWALAGDLLEAEQISLSAAWLASGRTSEGWQVEKYGDTPLIAICRCYVAIKLGDEVEVPDELCA